MRLDWTVTPGARVLAWILAPMSWLAGCSCLVWWLATGPRGYSGLWLLLALLLIWGSGLTTGLLIASSGRRREEDPVRPMYLYPGAWLRKDTDADASR